MEKMNTESLSQFDEYVFIVDDESDLRELMSDAVASMGLKYRAYSSPEEAITDLRSYKCCLIISDYKMPKTTGLDFCKQVRTHYPLLPFVLATGYADKDVTITGLNLGITELIEKPFDFGKFKAMITNYVRQRINAVEQEKAENEEILTLFIEEATDILSDLDQLILRLEETPIDALVIDSLFRKIHTVKGGAGAIGDAKLLASLAHVFETDLALVKRGDLIPAESAINLFLEAYDLCKRLLKTLRDRTPPSDDLSQAVQNCIRSLEDVKNIGIKGDTADRRMAEKAPDAKSGQEPAVAAKTSGAASDVPEDEGIWVTNDKLDSLMKVSGELIVLKNSFQMLSRDTEVRTNIKKLEKRLSDISYSIGKITDHLQGEIMEVRKVKLDRALGKLQRITRQVCQEVRKKAKLTLNGTELGVDKSIAKALAASLTHMVRNSLDHGIETPEIRTERGKPAEGNLTITVQESQGVIYCVVEDDGNGIDQEKVMARALKNGLITEAQKGRLSEAEIYDLLFLPGFSTAEKVSSVSGRGVGMDVVKSSIVALNGKVKVESRLYHGTRMTLEIPVPKSVMVEQTILVASAEQVFAVPLTAVAQIIPMEELVQCEVNRITTCQFNKRTIQIGTYKQLLRLEAYGRETPSSAKMAVMVRFKHNIVGLLIDKIHDQLEAVIKPFDGVVKQMPGFKGTAILGDDRIAYVLAPEDFVKIALGGQTQTQDMAAAA